MGGLEDALKRSREMISAALEDARAELATVREREEVLERQIAEAERALGSRPTSAPSELTTTLHLAMADVLTASGNEGMTARELADAINRRGTYARKDGMPVEANQVHARANNYSAMFEKNGSLIRVSDDATVRDMQRAISLFKDDDDGFHAWLDEHPEGYVVNSERKPRKHYLVLHRPSCPHFDRAPQLNWTKDYIKVCAVDRDDLEEWAADTVGGEVTLCLSCFG